jgi:hypothetical protein
MQVHETVPVAEFHYADLRLFSAKRLPSAFFQMLRIEKFSRTLKKLYRADWVLSS